MMNLKSSVAFLKAVSAAGLGLVNSKSVQTDDGSCWHATLAKGKIKLVTVSNGGYGGPDEFRYHSDAKTTAADVQAILKEFYAVLAVVEFAQNNAIQGAEFEMKYRELSQAAFDVKKKEILASTPEVTEDVLGYIVAQLADAKETVSKLKRKNKVNLSWIQKDSDGSNYVSLKLADTPENRLKATNRYGNEIDVFIGDLIESL